MKTDALPDTAAKMRIINIFSIFKNPYSEAGWQLWDGLNLIGVYHTRKAARDAAATMGRPTRAIAAGEGR